MHVVDTSQLSKDYGAADRPVRVLSNVDLCVEQEERVSLVGRSGSGKTTLLNLLAGLDRPTSGTLRVADRHLEELSSNELAHYRCHDVGVVFQSFQLLSHRTALQNIEIPLALQRVPQAERLERAHVVLERVGLSHRAKHRPTEMSGGEQQRVAIARAIVHGPKLLLADEPTGNLDSKMADQVTDLILEVVAENNAAMILITHDQRLAEYCGQRVIELVDGQIKGAT